MAGSAQAGSGRSPRARGGASSSPACVSRSTFIPPRARGGSRSTERRTLSRVPACAGRGACPTASRLARSARSRARGAGRRRKGRGAPLQVHPRACGGHLPPSSGRETSGVDPPVGGGTLASWATYIRLPGRSRWGRLRPVPFVLQRVDAGRRADGVSPASRALAAALYSSLDLLCPERRASRPTGKR